MPSLYTIALTVLACVLVVLLLTVVVQIIFRMYFAEKRRYIRNALKFEKDDREVK